MLKEYKGLLHTYNNEKSYENKETLLAAKKKYKKYMKKSKYKYKRYEGDMFDFLRKHNPKHFYSLFSKGKSKSGKCSLTNDDFQAYFKSLIEGNSADHTESTCDYMNKYILILIPLVVVRVMVKYWAEIVTPFNKQAQIIIKPFIRYTLSYSSQYSKLNKT